MAAFDLAALRHHNERNPPLSTIVLHLISGKTLRFPHEGLPGNPNATKRLTYVTGFVIITHENGDKESYPSDLIERIEETPAPGQRRR
jgi:hypothetical protein